MSHRELTPDTRSPSDSSTAIRRKVMDYLSAGAQMVWIVDPPTPHGRLLRAAL